MKILHVITGLDQGGAEGCLTRLVLSDSTHEHHVISLMDEGTHGAALRAAGISLHTIGMSRGRPSWRGMIQLIRVIKTIQPDVVQTWLYHADLLGGIAARVAGAKALCWGIRNTLIDQKKTSFINRLLLHLCARISHFLPSKIVSCSAVAAEEHIGIGYSSEKMVVIPNGIDLTHFHPDLTKRREVRGELGIGEAEFLLGMVARCDPQKDYQNLLLALQIFCKKTATPWKFLIVGRNTESLAGEVERLGLAPHILILGARHDIAHVLNALDVHVLSSAYGEGFPNVLAEAMACGVPCVATDVGDAARIVENTGWIVAPRDPEFLADALNQALASYQSIFWEERKSCALHRIENHFSIEKMRSTYHDLWLSVHQ